MMLRATLAILALAALDAHAFGVQELFDSLATTKPRRAAFTEKKYFSMLDKPVESSGEFVFTPPAKLEKRTRKPKPESILIDGDIATLERDGQKHMMRLSQHAAIAVFIDSIRSTLAGDLAALTRAYSAGVAGDAAKWRLTLRPLDPQMASLVERIEISGAKSHPRTVEVFQADGDRSVMTLTPLDK